jgi:hypothetical protein
MNNAAQSEKIGETQAAQADAAISPASAPIAERLPEKPVKRTVSGIDRNIAATQDLIDRTKARMEAHRADASWDDGETIKSFNKTLANLSERMEILKRLRAKEVKYDDR